MSQKYQQEYIDDSCFLLNAAIGKPVVNEAESTDYRQCPNSFLTLIKYRGIFVPISSDSAIRPH